MGSRDCEIMNYPSSKVAFMLDSHLKLQNPLSHQLRLDSWISGIAVTIHRRTLKRSIKRRLVFSMLSCFFKVETYAFAVYTHADEMLLRLSVNIKTSKNVLAEFIANHLV